MWYKIRSERLHDDIQRAKIRLSAVLKLRYLTRINHRKYPKQPSNVVSKHALFTGNTKICHYDIDAISALALIKRPSNISRLGKTVLKKEAMRLNIYKRGMSEQKLRDSICEEWRKQIRSELQTAEIDSKSIDNNHLEDYYNVYLGIKRAALISMSGMDVIPRSLSVDDLHTFMTLHHLSIPKNASRLMCVSIIENYLAEHIIPFESPLADIDRRRLSASCIATYQFGMLNLKQLQEEIRKYGEIPATYIRCKDQLSQIIERELATQYKSVFDHIMDLTCQMYGIHCDGDNVSDRMNRLFSKLQTIQEVIPIVYL